MKSRAELVAEIKALRQRCAALERQQIDGKDSAGATATQPRHRLVMEHASDIIYTLSMEGVILSLSDSFERLTGWPRDEWIGRRGQELLHPDDVPTAAAKLARVQAGEQVDSLIARVRTATADHIWVEFRPRAVHLDDAPERVVGIARDITAQVEMQVALQRSERRFRALSDLAPVAVFVTDAEGRCTYCNPYWSEMTGLTAAESLNDDWLLAVHPDDRPRVQALHRRVVGQRGRWGLSVRLLRPDDRVVWTQGQVVALEDEDGAISGYMGALVDITEHKELERNLLHAAQEWRVCFDAIGSGMLLVDATGTIMRCNQAMTGILGRSFGEIVDQPISTALQGLCHQTPAEWLQRLATVRGRIRQTCQYDGRWYEVSADPIVDAEAQLAGAVMLFADVTERRQAEEALRQSEHKLGELLRQSPDAVTLMDDQGIIVEWNEAHMACTGIPRHEAIGRPIWEVRWELTPPEDRTPETREGFRERVQQLLEAGDTPWLHRIQLREIETRDGTRRWVQTKVVRIHNVRGVFAASYSRDVTDQRRLEAQLRHAETLEAIGLLAGGVAHEFNNLLTVINGYTEYALADATGQPGILQALGEVKKAGKRAAELTRQLLDFGRREEFHPCDVSVNTRIRAMMRMLDPLIGEQIRLKTRLKALPDAVWADPAKLEQALINLAVNARDAMPEGGTLTFETRNAFVSVYDADRIADASPGPHVVITVADTGHGMTDAVREHLFEPFFTTKPVGQGTGLGLAMVHGVVRRLKGHIRVDTAPDEGTAFHLYLPQLPLQEQCETRPSTEKAVGGRETILVVEDEIQVRRLAAAMLKRLSYRVVEAESAEEALRICSDAKAGIDLVLTDVVMPRISGPELARRLQESCPDIAAIYMSGYPQHEVQRRSGLADLTPMLRKPFTIESLDQAVRQALDGHDRAAAQTP